MKKRKQTLVPINAEQPSDLNQEFIKNFKESLLLALLRQGKLTQRQFDWCMEQMRNPP